MKKIDEKYTWDLSKIFISDEEFFNAIEEIKKLLKKVLKLKGIILKDDTTLLQYYNIDEEMNNLLEKVYLYANLGFNNNMDNKDWQEKKETAVKLYDDVSNALSFVFPELMKSDFDHVKELLNKNDNLKKYSFDMETTFRYKLHTLSEAEENILTAMSPLSRLPRDTFNMLDNVDIKFDSILDETGKEVELNNSNFVKFLQNSNSSVREAAFKSVYKYYGSHINTISSLYSGKIKANVFLSKTRNYNSSLEASLFDDSIDKKLYETLIQATSKNVDLLQKYYKIKAKMLNIPKLHIYDTYLNIVQSKKSNIDYDHGKQLVLNALMPLGETYINDITHLFENRCVDVYSKKAKKDGAYQWGPYGVEPYVSLNYENNINSISTIAHEMGHAMHSYYSDKNNIRCYAGYPIFLAEIASIVNEILFSDYMLKQSKTLDEKLYFIVEYLDKFKSSVYRQTMFAEFEYLMHNTYESGNNITKDLLCDTYYNLNKKYFGNSIILDKDIKYEWSRVPHFYTSFYVYKYSTGFICASIIASKLLSNDDKFKEKYIEFLSSGGSDYPLNILKKLGIDIMEEKTLEDAFKLFNNKLNELSKLIKERSK